MYYIVENGAESGPFDMIALVKKVKKGALTPQTMVRAANAPTPASAGSIKDLAPLFAPATEQEAPRTNAPKSTEYDLKPITKNALNFLQMNHASVIYTGVFLIVATLVSLLLGKVPLVGYVLGGTAGFVLYAGYLSAMTRMSRGQVLQLGAVFTKLRQNLLQLMLAALVLSVPVGIGLVLLLAPGLLILTFYIFTPLLIMEKGMSFWPAMEASRKKVMSMGANNLGVLFALVVANFFGGLLLMLPLLFTLPMTANALTDIFDEQFSE